MTPWHPVGRRGNGRGRTIGVAVFSWLAFAVGAWADPAKLPPASADLPDMGLSVLRVFGALALVLALFLGGVWLFRNWQRLMVSNGRAPKLNVLEARRLGNRHALYVVGYEQQRFLIASSPTGINLLSPLPAVADGNGLGGGNGSNTATAPLMSFAQTLQQVLHRK